MRLPNFGMVKRVRRSRHQTHDANFVGFDKYRNQGAYHWKELDQPGSYRDKIELLRARVQLDDRCLDLGCGDGAYAFELSKACDEVVGIDADFDAIVCANEKLQSLGVTNVSCVQMPLSGVPEAPIGSFDVVYSMDVLEHLPRPEELFEVAVAKLRPGGLLVIGTPLYIQDDLISPYHVTEYTDQQLRDMFERFVPLQEEVVLAGPRHGQGFFEREFWTGIGRA